MLLKEDQTFAKLISDDAFLKIVDALGKKTIEDMADWYEKNRQQIESQSQGETIAGSRSEIRKSIVRHHLTHKLFQELFVEGMKNPPTDEELLARLTSKAKDDRDAFYSLAASDVRFAMRQEVLGERGRQSISDATKFFDSKFQPFFPRWNRNRGSGPGGGPRGDGRPDGERRRGQRDERPSDDDDRRRPPEFDGNRPPGRPNGPPREHPEKENDR
jgi:hypothetical protein